VIEKLPVVGDLPVIGALFRSNKFQRNQTELVIIVTPYLVHGVKDVELATPVDGYRPVADIDRVLNGKLYQETEHETAGVPPGSEDYPHLRGPAGYIMR